MPLKETITDTANLETNDEQREAIGAFFNEHLMTNEALHGCGFAKSTTPPHALYIRVYGLEQSDLNALPKTFRGYAVVGELRPIPNLLSLEA